MNFAIHTTNPLVFKVLQYVKFIYKSKYRQYIDVKLNNANANADADDDLSILLKNKHKNRNKSQNKNRNKNNRVICNANTFFDKDLSDAFSWVALDIKYLQEDGLVGKKLMTCVKLICVVMNFFNKIKTGFLYNEGLKSWKIENEPSLKLVTKYIRVDAETSKLLKKKTRKVRFADIASKDIVELVKPFHHNKDIINPRNIVDSLELTRKNISHF